MDRDTRNAIERATQQARNLLEEDFAAQLEGDFDVHRGGSVAAEAGAHLSARKMFQRERIVAAIEHKRAAGMSAADAVADYLRDAAFTTLNRFVALKMLEARELMQQCVTNGEQSSGYREFCGMAPGLALLPDSAGYRLYIECLFDELATEVKVLFDRRDPSSVLWPRRATFEHLLEILNASELTEVWGEDETIGWVYQYFNGHNERRKMREESQAPRNSRDLAVRNQFFTPRYVVQFLTDNTLGRIWYEMCGTTTVLADRCRYMVRKPLDEFAPRAKKDPRDVRVLDPACGSGHFLLYAFDVLLAIYEEAYADSASPKSEPTGRTLAEDYPSLDALRRAVPGLILAHNLHGVDIDSRCVQIAQLALWMRAQRAFGDFGIRRAERPQIRRSKLVVAEPLVADDQLTKAFVSRLGDAELGRVFTALVDALKRAGELGLLLRLETIVTRSIKRGQTGDLFAPAEERIRSALARFVAETGERTRTSVRLFADDAVQGLGLFATAAQKFDVVLMNPPFGEMTHQIQEYADGHYPEGRNDIYAVFVRRAIELASRANGYVGALTSRAFITGRDHRHFRRSLLSGSDGILVLFADLGAGILDGAMVETAAYVLAPPASAAGKCIRFVDARRFDRVQLASQLSTAECVEWPCERFLRLPQADLVYDLDDDTFHSLTRGELTFEPEIGRVTFGLTTKDDSRFVRLRWEVPPHLISSGGPWTPFAKGGEYAWFTATTHLLVKRGRGSDEIAAFAELRDGNVASTRRSSSYYFTRAVCFSRRSQRGFSARRLRPNACFSDKTAVIVPHAIQTDWLYALAPVLASSEYQRLIAAQSKFGSYEIGPIKGFPVPDHRALAQRERWIRLYKFFDDLEAADETSETFRGLPERGWSPVSDWPEARAALQEGLRASGLTPDPKVIEELEDWVAERSTRFDFETARRSWAVGVVFGRFLEHRNDAQPDLEPFAAPEPCPALRQFRPGYPNILVDDHGHSDDIVERLHPLLPDVDGDELRDWLRTRFWGLHLGMYSRSRRSAPIYCRLSVPSGSYSIWLYALAVSGDELFRAHSEYVTPKLLHEERRLEQMRSAASGDGTTARRLLAAQEHLVEELRVLRAEMRGIAALWSPNVEDGVLVNHSLLWRLVPHDRAWQTELRSVWADLCQGEYDWAHLAMHLWPERVVRKCATDRSLAIAHGLGDVFWVKRSDGKWTPRKMPLRSVEELVHERTSPAVKAALKALLEAPGATGSGGRGRRGRRRTASSAEGGDA